MGVNYNPKATTDNLVLCLDAANKKSYNFTHNLMIYSDVSGASGIYGPTGWAVIQPFGRGGGPGIIPSNNLSLTIGGVGYWQFDLVGTTESGNWLNIETPSYNNPSPLNYIQGIVAGTTYTITYNYSLPSNFAAVAAVQAQINWYDVNNVALPGSGQFAGSFTTWNKSTTLAKSSFTATAPAAAVKARLWFVYYNPHPVDTTVNYTGFRLGGIQLNIGSSATDYVATTTTQIFPPTNFTDLSSMGNNGVIEDSTAYNSLGWFNFDGVNDAIRLNNTLANFVNKSFTAEAWVRQTYPTYRPTTVMQSSSFNVGGWSLALNYTSVNNICMFLQNTGLDMVVRSDTNVGAFINSWNHVVGSYNSLDNSVNLYLNGKLVKSQIITTSAGQTSNLLYIGRPTQGGWSYFTGDIGLTKIYDRALTATEVAQNYNATSGRFGI